MCGIFGAIALTGASLRHPECLARMAASLRHRGPDGERIVGHARARLGARRLAIMDLTTGDQPFQSPDGAVWMVCNGEIYNSADLRREATGWGYPFRSRGDIENIVPFYARYGEGVVERLDGMFGLAIWDDRRGRLLLARDRAGEKPLFWTPCSQGSRNSRPGTSSWPRKEGWTCVRTGPPPPPPVARRGFRPPPSSARRCSGRWSES